LSRQKYNILANSTPETQTYSVLVISERAYKVSLRLVTHAMT